LYDWNTARTACPAGWHLPTREEWDVLITAAGGSSAGKKLKSKSPNWDGTDDFGFSALPGGSRGTDGSFDNLGSDGSWWTATEYGAASAYYRDMYTGYAYTDVGEDLSSKGGGLSARCLQE
jgi:uncharacterized protein (TIGR02145 family)